MAIDRKFTDQPAVRERVPLLVGLTGPSGSGKTFSALRLATGMQRITGGEIFVIDSESRRALHYADKFTFRHVEFKAPFSPLDYLAAIEYCVSKSAGVLIVDSASHEHEGPGGVLEWHERELDRIAGMDEGRRNKMTFPAWAKPKAARRRLINSILQMGIDAIFCFRAKQKIKMQTGKDPIELGWMPIAGDEFVYEMTLQCLLYPGSGGVPTWNPGPVGERAMTKLPEQFKATLAKIQPLSEDLGQQIAEWAAGDAKTPAEAELKSVLKALSEAKTTEERKAVADANRRKRWTPEQRAKVAAVLAQYKVEAENGDKAQAAEEVA